MFLNKCGRARRLTTLRNENQAEYHFAYDPMNRLTEEVGFDNKRTAYQYNEAGVLIAQQEFALSDSQKLLRTTTLEHDEFGRLISQSVSNANGKDNSHTQYKTQTDYHYDRAGRLVRLSEANNTALFYYNALGQLVQQGIWQENGTLEQCAYEFDANGNRTKLTLPNNDEICYFYYGTGHLSAIKYNDKLITEIKRDARHQEIG